MLYGVLGFSGELALQALQSTTKHYKALQSTKKH